MRSYNYLLVDFISPVGHKRINDFFINDLTERGFNTTLIAKKNYSSIRSKNFVYFRTLFSNDCQGWRHYIDQIFFSFISFIINLRRVIEADKVIFLSYDNVANIHLFIFLKCLLRKKIYIVEHNTIHQDCPGGFSLIKKMARMIQAYLTTSVVFENYIGKYIEEKYNCKYVVVNHPIILSERPENIKHGFDVFSPSGSTPLATNVFLAKYSTQTGVEICVKGNAIRCNVKSFIQEIFFDKYDELMQTTKIIIIGAEFEYRVSGVFYEALSTNAYIVMKKCSFSINVCKKYPGKIWLYVDLEELEVILNQLLKKNTESSSINVNLFNSQSSLSLIKDC
jgi:hypothetical protein